MSRGRSVAHLLCVQGFATLVAMFKTEARAQLIADCFKEQEAKVYQTRVAIPFFKKDRCKLFQALKKTNPEKIKEYPAYQELTITVELPRNLPLKSVPLVLNSETAMLIKALKKTCGRPTITQNENVDQWQFNYAGKLVYWKCRNKRFMFNRQIYSVPVNIEVLLNCI